MAEILLRAKASSDGFQELLKLLRDRSEATERLREFSPFRRGADGGRTARRDPPMRLQSLNHLIEVVRAVARPQRLLILGSASLLPAHPELGAPGKPLELTNDADLLVEPVNDGIAESLQLAAGLDSAFMARFGYCADILRPAIDGIIARWAGKPGSGPLLATITCLLSTLMIWRWSS